MVGDLLALRRAPARAVVEHGGLVVGRFGVGKQSGADVLGHGAKGAPPRPTLVPKKATILAGSASPSRPTKW